MAISRTLPENRPVEVAPGEITPSPDVLLAPHTHGGVTFPAGTPISKIKLDPWAQEYVKKNGRK